MIINRFTHLLMVLSFHAVGHIAQAQTDSILTVYVKEALETNVALDRQNLSYEQSLEALKEAKQSFLPVLSFNASYQTAEGQNPFGLQIQDQVNGLFQNLDLINNTLEQVAAPNYPDIGSYSAGGEADVSNTLNQNQQTFLRIAVPIYNAAIIQNHEIKKELAQISYLSREDYKDEVVKEVKTAYYQWLQSGEIVRVYENTLRLANENVRTNRSLLSNSKITKDVYLSAQARQAEVSQELTNARKDQRLTQAFFNFLLNRSYDTPIERSTDEASITLPVESVKYYLQAARTNRKDLRQIQQLQAVREAQTDLQRGNFLPRANVALDAGYRGNEYSFTNEDDFVAFSAQLTWDLFTFGKNKTKVQQARLDQEIARTQQTELTKKVEIEVVEAYLEIQAALEAYQAATQEVAASRQELKLVQRKYELGQANRLTLESTETDYQNAQLREVTAKYTVLSQKAMLERAASTYNYE